MSTCVQTSSFTFIFAVLLQQKILKVGHSRDYNSRQSCRGPGGKHGALVGYYADMDM